ncbi:MAG: hypothetical protein N2317_01130 [Syntrophales bacterium]|nr:hypothetical protein [Syntrophales bacterium]
MGIIVELVSIFLSCKKWIYPWRGEFRWGGARLTTGDWARVEISPGDRVFEGHIYAEGNDDPYLTGSIHFLKDIPSSETGIYFNGFTFGDLESSLLPLPYYANCFVCGEKRKAPGLHRRFYCFVSPEGRKQVYCPVGFNEKDMENFFLFRSGEGEVHPLALLAAVDETMAWGGFLCVAQGAVTVRLQVDFFRPLTVGDEFVVWGQGERVRGKNPERMFFWSSGGVLAFKNGRILEPVAFATGQWMVVPELTIQMKNELQPSTWMQDVFRLAGAPLDDGW